MPSTTINRGNVGSTTVISLALTPASVGATTVAEQTFSVPGLLTTDQVSGVSLISGAWTNLTSIVSFRASAANTLGISFANGTAGALTPPAGTYLIEINRPESQSLPANLA